MGFDVVATDLPDVISSVLAQNIARNASSQLPSGSAMPSDASSGVVQVRILDWTVPPEQWNWHDIDAVAIAHNSNTPAITISQQTTPPPSSSPLAPVPEHSEQHRTGSDSDGVLGPPFDLIISSDTLYSPEIIHPLLRTLHALSTCSISVSASASASATTRTRPPPVYLCIERRDPVLIDRALSEAKEHFNFLVERVPHRKVAKALERGGAAWDKKDWEGIEIWKLTLRTE